MLTVIDSISDAGARQNDDLWGRAGDAAWILDGATGLSAERMFPRAASDAAWFVSAVHQALRLQSGGVSLEEVVATVQERFSREAARIAPDPAAWPSASIALLRISGDRAELANLGDCKLLWRRRAGGDVASFGSSQVVHFDRLVVERIKQLHARGIVDAGEVWAQLVPLIQQNRERMNTTDGYWILDVDGRGLSHVQKTATAIDGELLFLLVTDGFYRLVDTYAVYTDETLFEAAVAGGLAPLCARLREIEACDPLGLAYPRIKPRDDATAVLVRVEASHDI